jgi:predicted SAM-dependent methyltransferase
MLIDKKNIIAKLHNGEITSVALELGCGGKKRSPNAIGIDQIDFDCVDIVGDALEILSEIPTNSISTIQSYHFMEHVSDFKRVIIECERILMEGGRLELVVPHFSNPYYYSDYTHKNFFGLYSLSYFIETPIFKRVVPKYGINLSMKLFDVKLIFRSERPFYVRHAFGWIVTKLINSNNYFKEFYEVNLSNLYSCHEMHFIAIKTRSMARN